MKRKIKDFWLWLTEKHDGSSRLEGFLTFVLVPPTLWFLTAFLFSF